MPIRTLPLGAAYARLWTAAALANLADGVFRVALPLLAVRITTSPALVAGVVVAQRLPWLFLALPAGALADRLDRRRTMVRVQLLRVLVLGVLAVVVVAEAESMATLYAAALVLGVGETLFDTAAQSILPTVVDRARLSEANGRLFAVEMTANELVGPTIGGLLAAAALWSAFAASAGAYALAAASLALMTGTYRPARTGPPTPMRAEIAEGLRFVWGNPLLRTLGLMLGVSAMALTAWMAVFVLFAVEPGPMGLSQAGYGLLLSAGAVGGVLGSRIAPLAERRLGRARCLALSVLALSLAMLAPVATPGVVANVAALVVTSTAVVVWNVITVSLRQSITPDRLLGRMNAAYRLLGWGMMPLGAALGGVVGEVFGLRAAFAAAAALGATVLAATTLVTDEAIARAEEAAGDRVRAMARAFTCLGAGADLDAAYRSAVGEGGPVAATTGVREVDVPDGANPSKLGTWVQRVAQDPAAAADVPDDHRAAVEKEAVALMADPSTCLAIRLEGDLAERTRTRAGAAADDAAYLLFGLAPES